MTPSLLSSTSIEGTTVKNLKDEQIGEIKDLMIDWESGKVAYAVLSFGGFLGFGDKLFAFPLRAFDFNSPDDHPYARLDVSKEKLENAPGFDKDHWPSSNDTTFTNKVHSYYGYNYSNN